MSVSEIQEHKLLTESAVAGILKNLEKVDIKILDENLAKLKEKGFTNIEAFIDKTGETKGLIIKYDYYEGLLTHYIYPDGAHEFFVLNDEKLKDKEIYAKYINEPAKVRKLTKKERRELKKKQKLANEQEKASQ